MTTRRPKFLIIIGLLVLVAFVLLVTHLSSKPSYTISHSYALPAGFSAVAPYGSNSFIFSNGQALMVYNYTSRKTTQLSPSVDLSGAAIDTVSVSADNQFVLFHDEQVSTGGGLYQQLVNQGLNPQQDYWWLYNVAEQTFQPLPQSPLLAEFNGNTVETLTETGGKESLTAYDTASLTAQAPISIPGSSSFIATSSGFFLETADNQIISTKNGVVSNVLASNATLVGVTANGQQAIIVTGQGSSRQLSVLNTATRSTQSIANGIVGQPVWSSAGTVLYTVSGPNTSTTLYSYDLASHKTWLWHFSGSATNLGTLALTPAVLAGTKTAVVNDNQNNYYLIQPDIQ